MNQELTEIARQLTELEGFEWAAGMAYHLDGRRQRMHGNDPSAWLVSFGYPDHTDAATGGILLEALGPGWAVVNAGGYWGVQDVRAKPLVWHTAETLAEACARALIARGYYRRREG
jgi:hypothetical protein